MSLLNLFTRDVRESPQGKEKGGAPESDRRGNVMLANNNAFPKRVYLSPEEWAEVPPNPRQRDTEHRAARADHLRKFHPIHAVVNMARLPDGRRYKLDGHTRSFLWGTGEVEAPDLLVVDTWDCEDLDRVKELYGYFDNPSAVEGSRDRMFGAYREQNLDFKSNVLAGRKYVNALRIAHGYLFGYREASSTSEYDLVRYWLPELRLLDDCRPHNDKFPGAIVAAALLTFRRYGPSASEFWTKYSRDEGVKVGVTRDAVQALADKVKHARANRHIGARAHALALVAIVLAAFENHRRGQTYDNSGIKPLHSQTVDKWMVAAKATLRSWG